MELPHILRSLSIATIIGSLISVSAGDVPYYETSSKSVAGDYSKNVLGGKEGGYPTLPVNRLKVDLFGAASYVYDTNTTQTPIAVDASIFVFSFGANVMMCSEARRVVYYGVNYLGQAFVYDNNISEAGRDPLEHSVGAFLGVNGGRTRMRFDADYRRNNGNSLQFDGVDLETQRAQSNDYDFNFNLSRELAHGSLEFGAGYLLRDFDPGLGLNDGESVYGDAAWFFNPGFAPKTSLGFGIRAGADDFDANFNQNYVTPSFRWRYALSGKTTLYSNLGYEFRSVDGPTGIDSENFVYSGGVSWAASPKTRFDLGYYSSVRPSYTTTGEDVHLSGANLRINNRLP